MTIRCNSITLNNGNDTLVDSPTDILGRPRISFGRTDLGAYESNFDCDNYVQLATKVLLQGPFNTTSELMHDSLRVRGFIPTEEPYTALGFTQKGNGGGETVGPSVLSKSGNNAIVDWIFLELRDASDSTRVVSTRSALLQRDGDVVDTDGDSPVTFSGAPVGNYYIAIRHRNHLSCRTRNTIPLHPTLDTTINFMDGSTRVVGTNPLRAMGRFFALYAGDANHDGKVAYNGSANDRVAVLRIVGLNTVNNEYAGYYNEDVNMDGKVRYTGAANDRVLILSLVGLNTVNNIILQQY